MLEFPGVEPKHAQCYWDGSPRVVLKSLGAPLIVNGEQTDRTLLAAYDEIRIGEVKLTFLISKIVFSEAFVSTKCKNFRLRRQIVVSGKKRYIFC